MFFGWIHCRQDCSQVQAKLILIHLRFLCLRNLNQNFYPPKVKRSLGQGNVLPPVCHSVRGGGYRPQHASQVTWQGAWQSGVLCAGGSVQGVCAGGSLCRGSLSGILGDLSAGGSVWGTGGSLSRRVSVRETPQTETPPYGNKQTSRWYASYWNAFLFVIITTFKRSLWRLCFYMCLSFCPQGEGCIPACLAGLQVHTQGGGWGVWLGGGLQVHTQAGGWGVWLLGGWPGPRPGGKLRGLAFGGVTRPTPMGCIPACTEAEPPPADGFCCGRYASYWNAFLLYVCKCQMHHSLHQKKDKIQMNILALAPMSVTSWFYCQICWFLLHFAQMVKLKL